MFIKINFNDQLLCHCIKNILTGHFKFSALGLALFPVLFLKYQIRHYYSFLIMLIVVWKISTFNSFQMKIKFWILSDKCQTCRYIYIYSEHKENLENRTFSSKLN